MNSYDKTNYIYNKIKDLHKTSSGSQELSDQFLEQTILCLDILENEFERIELNSLVSGKSYFSFLKDKDIFSRAINKDLFGTRNNALELIKSLKSNHFPLSLDPKQITQSAYTIVISYAAIRDLISNGGDRKTPGGYYEYLTAHLLSTLLNEKPSKQIKIPLGKDGEEIGLTVDLIFDRGLNKPRYSIALKTSSRERASEVWIHQRILDQALEGDLVGLFFGLAETKLDHRSKEVVEIVVPNQWRLYQQYVGQIESFYYLDPPERLLKVPKYPPLSIKHYGEAFFELD